MAGSFELGHEQVGLEGIVDHEHLCDLDHAAAGRVCPAFQLNRVEPGASPRLVLTDFEMGLLDQLAMKDQDASHTKTLADYLTRIARLGGYLARARDPPPGNMVMWRGLTRITDITLGATIGTGLVGN